MCLLLRGAGLPGGCVVSLRVDGGDGHRRAGMEIRRKEDRWEPIFRVSASTQPFPSLHPLTQEIPPA